MANQTIEQFGLETIKGLNFCGCGNPEEGYEALRESLKAHCSVSQTWEERTEKNKVWTQKFGGNGYDYLILYFMDSAGLTEHGGSVGGCWLSKKGEAVLTFLEAWGTDPDEWPEERDFENG